VDKRSSVRWLALRVLTWNLKHGLAVPPAGRDLLPEFSRALSEWEWDVALLQEVPPWWPPVLVPGAEPRSVLTSRNFGLVVRRAIATRWPDLIKSNGGGANAILIRGSRVLDHRCARLTLLPERRWLHAVQLPEMWVGNLHASGRHIAENGREFEIAREAMLEWAGEQAAVLGGDFNVPALYLPGFTYAGGGHLDHVLASGLRVTAPAEVLDRGHLSDHPPVVVTVAPDDDGADRP
jgi:endonuclease/exonuclease/phosphatase family metal-dependent hydrolase